MPIYFGVLKEEVSYCDIQDQLDEETVIVTKHYPRLNLIRFESKLDIESLMEKYDFFISVEEEKTDFSFG